MALYGNDFFGYIAKETTLGGAHGSPSFYWHQKMQFNENPAPTTLMIKTNTPFKYPCQDRYINFDYEVVLSGNITLQLLNQMVSAWQGVADGTGIGRTIKSYTIQMQDFKTTGQWGRTAKGCIVSNINIKHTANEFVQVDITFIAKSITGYQSLASSVIAPESTCQNYISHVSLQVAKLYPIIGLSDVVPSFTLQLQTQWADKMLTHTNTVLTNPIWQSKNVVMNLDFLVGQTASPKVGTVYISSENTDSPAYTVKFEQGDGWLTLEPFDVRITGITLPDPDKGIWQGNIVYQIVSGIDEKFDEDMFVVVYNNQ